MSLLVFISVSGILICIAECTNLEKFVVEPLISFESAKAFYNWFFQDVRALKVINLIDKNSKKNLLRMDLDNLLVSMGDHHKKVMVSEVSMEEKIEQQKQFFDGTLDIEKTDIKSWNVYESENQLKKYADFNRGFILVSSSIVLSLNYFEKREDLRQFYHRDISIVIITDCSFDNTHSNYQIHQLLEFAWRKHGLINIIAQTWCNHSHTFFIYRPLVFRNGTYGKLESYKLEEVMKYPKGILNSIENLNNISLKTNMFYRYPTAMEVTKPVSRHVGSCYDVLDYSHNINGIDGCTLGHLSKHLNFNAIIEDIKSQGIYRFGHILPNGSLTGSLGDVNQRRTDIAMNGVFLEYKYAFFNLEFSQVDQSYQICPVVPKAGKIPAWASILMVFSVWSWISIGILAAMMWVFLDIFSITTLSTETCGYRLVLAIYLFGFQVILAGIFNGHLYRNFSTVSYYPDLNSLQELADSDLQIETTLNIFDDEDTESDLIQRLSKKVVKNFHGTSPAIERAAFSKNIVAVERKEEALFKIYTKFLDQNGSPLLHVLDDCIMTQFISKILPEGSPFLLLFNIWFSRFHESGLSHKWLTSAMMPTPNSSVIVRISPRLGLDKLVLVFGVLLVGCLISAATFIGEIVIYRI